MEPPLHAWEVEEEVSADERLEDLWMTCAF